MSSSFLESNELLLNVTLSPSYIGNCRIGVEESLNACLMRYREDLKGVIVCYSKLQLMQRTGKIIDETPDVHFNVRAQALVFRPTPGMKLVGTVNKISSGYVGMLVGGIFNASISATHMQQHYSFNEKKQQWIAMHKTDSNKNIALGSQLPFQVDRTHVAAGLVSISGSLATPSKKRKDTSEGKKQKKKKKKQKHTDAASSGK